MTTNLLCTFQVEGQHFGIDVMRIQEILRFQRTTFVPLAPNLVRGLINLRGQVVTTIDLRLRLGLGHAAVSEAPTNIVVNTEDGPLSLLVDEIGEVLSLDEASYEPPPPTLDGAFGDLVRGVFKVDGRLILELDVDRTLDPTSYVRVSY